MKFIARLILITSFISGCGGDYRPPDIFNYDIGFDHNGVHDPQQKFKMKLESCPDCTEYSIRNLYRPVVGSLVLQLNPYTYGGYYEKAAKVENSTNSCTDGTPPDSRNIKGKPPTTFTERERARNALIGASLRLSDLVISTHLGGIKSTEVDINMLLGLGTAGLTAGASVAGVAAAKALSAAATGTNASRSIFNETTYRNALGETLVSAIEADLISKKHDILEKLLYLCVDSYPVEIALDDVQNYKDSGSFYNGLALVRKAAEQNTTAKIEAVKVDSGSGNATIPGVSSDAAVSTEVAKYVSQATAEITSEEQEIDKIVAYVSNGAGVIGTETLSQLINKAKIINPLIFTTSVNAKIKSATTGDELKKLLSDQLLDATINPLYQSLSIDKQ